MMILALDTALEACSACVFSAEDGPVASETRAMQRGHAEALLPLVETVVAAAGGFGVLARVATTVGPGSFTGLRVAISAARGFSLALGVPCVGLSTLAAIAAPHLDPQDGQPVAAVVDARHGAVYFQLFSPQGRTVLDARCIPLREAARIMGGAPVKIAGPAAALLFEEARLAGAPCTVADFRAAPDIAWVARLGLAADPSRSRPRPLYLKPADATPQEAGRVARQ